MSFQNTLLDEGHRRRLLLAPSLGAGNFLHFAASLYPKPCEQTLLSDVSSVVCHGETRRGFSVHTLRALAGRWALWYRKKGVVPGEPVGVYCEDGLNYLLHFVALTAIGAVPALTNGAMVPPIAAKHFGAIGVRYVLCDGDRLSDLTEYLDPDSAAIDLGAVCLGMEELEEEAYFSHTPHSPVMITHSSGTTGVPKAVILHHEQWFYGIRDLLKKPHAQGVERYLNALPTSHNSSIAFVIHGVLSGSHILLASRRDGQSVGDLIEAYAPSTVVAFAQTHVELALLEGDRRRFSSVNTWINSGDAVHEVHIKKLVQYGFHIRGNTRIEGSQFIDGLGSSEMGHISFHILHTPYTNHFRRCVGFAQPWVDVQVFAQDGTPVKTGEVGMLGVRSPSITPGYWNNSALTYQSRMGDHWLTGDMVFIDEAGRVFHVDRVSDVIHTRSGPCYSLLMEECILAGVEGLEECTVVGVPDGSDDAVSVPVALVVCARPSTQDDLLAAIAHLLKDHGLPGIGGLRIVAHEDIPKGITGKVLKRVVRERLGSFERFTLSTTL